MVLKDETTKVYEEVSETDIENNQILQQLRGYQGNQNILMAGQAYQYTAWERDEFVKCCNDIHYFIRNYMKIVTLDRGLVPFTLYPYQHKIVDTLVRDQFVIGKLPRQSGKTTMTVAYLLWYVLFNMNKKVAILAHRANTARELFNKIRLAYEHLPKFLQAGIAPGGWNKGSITLGNGSSIKADATSSGSIRGESFNIIFLDEFAFVKNNLADEFMNSVYPTISAGSSSKCIIFSTPKGMNHFHDMWEEAVKGKSGFTPCEIQWNEVPGRDDAWKAAQIAKIGLRSWNQEFECQFLGTSDTLLETDTLLRMKRDWEDPIFEGGGWKLYADPAPGKRYAMCVDTSRGLGLDFHAVVVIDVTSLPWKVVATFHDNKIYPTILPNVIANAAKKFNNAHILVEISDIGQQVADMLIGDLDCDNVIRVSSKPGVGQTIGFGFAGKVANGIKTSVSTKRVGCADLKTLIEAGKLVITDKEIIKEFFTFVASPTQAYAAEEGKHDDLVMCLVMFGWLSHQRYFREETQDIREALEKQQQEYFDQQLTPFGVFDDGREQFSYDYENNRVTSDNF